MSLHPAAQERLGGLDVAHLPVGVRQRHEEAALGMLRVLALELFDLELELGG